MYLVTSVTAFKGGARESGSQGEEKCDGSKGRERKVWRL